MFSEISYYLILGKPVILYLGILTLLALLLTASIPVLNRRGVRVIAMKWHPYCAAATVLLALIHGALGVLAYI